MKHSTKRHSTKRRKTKKTKQRVTKRTKQRVVTKRTKKTRRTKKQRGGGIKPEQKKRIIKTLTSFVKPRHKQAFRKLMPALTNLSMGPFRWLAP